MPLWPDADTDLDSLAPPSVEHGPDTVYHYKDAQLSAGGRLTWRELETEYQRVWASVADAKGKADRLEFTYGEVLLLVEAVPEVEDAFYAFVGRLADHFTLVEAKQLQRLRKWVRADRVRIVPEEFANHFRSIGQVAEM